MLLFVVSVCDMFNIEAKKIIHCNSPSWSKSQDVADLQRTIENCLKMADKEHMKSIALPSVGSGKYVHPLFYLMCCLFYFYK